MGLTPVEEVPPTNHGGESYAREIIDEFDTSGHDVARVDLDGRSAKKVRQTLAAYIQRRDVDHVRVFKRGEEVYIARQ